MSSVRLVVAATLVAIAHRASAQRVSATLDLGGSSVRYADAVASSAFTVTPGVQMDFDRATLGASGSYAHLGSGSWTTQGAVGGSFYTPATGPLSGELSATAGGSEHKDGTQTGQTLGIVRGHLMNTGHGLWVGGGGGSTWDGAAWRRLFEGEAGFWSQLGDDGTALATITPTVVDDSIRYADAQVAVRWAGPRVELAASGGTRTGRQLRPSFGSVSTWGSASVVAWLAPNAAVVASAGTYPVDLTQGFPGGRFVSVALRFGSRTPRREWVRPVAEDGAVAVVAADGAVGAVRTDAAVAAVVASSAVVGFEMTAALDGRRTVRVLAPAAGIVELTGDFTGWSPVRLARSADGWWSVTVPVAQGTHQMNVRLDGGGWLVPPTLTALRDEFGGEVGLLIVP